MSETSWGTSKLIDAGDMSADITGAIILGAARHAHLQISSAGGGGATRAGVIYIQESADGATWASKTIIDKSTGTSYGSITVSTTVAVADTVDVEVEAERLRVFYDATSGVGTLNVWISVKD